MPYLMGLMVSAKKQDTWGADVSNYPEGIF